MAQGFGVFVLSYLDTLNPWSNVYGLARTLIASATGLILAINPTWVLFRPLSGEQGIVNCVVPITHNASLFCLARSHLDFARIVAILILALVATGWRPRLTGVFHWWITFSFFASARVIDGGEQVASVLTLLLLPITLTDGRKWHWEHRAATPVESDSMAIQRLIAWFAAIALQIQVAYIYLNACIEKLRVPEWLDGTMMYYVFRDSLLGAPHYLQGMLFTVSASPLVVMLAWPALLLELALGTNILMRGFIRRILFYCGVLFHCMIAIFIGIPSFGLIMIAALLLGVIPIGWDLRSVFCITFLTRAIRGQNVYGEVMNKAPVG